MPDEESLLFCVDMGTTRTRVWLTQDETIHAFQAGDFGVRDVAAGRPREWLANQLKNLLNATYAKASLNRYPQAIVAAGMITSAEGLREVPHLQAPVGPRELAAHLHSETFAISDAHDLPLLLVPGIRTGPRADTIESVLSTDMMRGEETLCVGLLESGALNADTVLLNLGSHWKWIWIDCENRISRSHTTLTGEMIHATQANTLIASALPQNPPQDLDADWVHHGFTEASRSGLSRALFCIRLLQQQKIGTPEERLSFLYGAFLQSELAQLKGQFRTGNGKLVVAGEPSLAQTWKYYAENAGVPATVLTVMDREQAYLRGLRKIYGYR
jgi:2-dehydro-3-deoxygalactonokinase